MISYMIHYDTLLQNPTDIITKCDSYFITKYNKSLLQNASGFLLHNATFLLQNEIVITKCDAYYKLRQYKLIQHNMVAKLEAYDLAKESLQLISDYLSYRKQRTKIGSAYSDWANVIRGIPQGSILGPLLFNIFINDIFLVVEKSDICNFADDNTLYSHGSNLPLILNNLEHDMRNLLYWFKINSLKANPGKFQFMILGKKNRLKYSLKLDLYLLKSLTQSSY